MQMVSKPTANPPTGSIIPYYMRGNNEPWYFNGINQTGTYKSFASLAAENDPFRINFDSADPIPPESVMPHLPYPRLAIWY